MAYEVPGAKVVAVDISEDALLLAKANARKLGLEHAVTLVCGDMLACLEGRGPFDAILSNPPYVRTGDIDGLEPEVSRFEPRAALDGGIEGMDHLNRLADSVHEHLKSGGLLVVECAGDQADRLLERILAGKEYRSAEVVLDLTGRKRMVKAVRK